MKTKQTITSKWYVNCSIGNQLYFRNTNLEKAKKSFQASHNTHKKHLPPKRKQHPQLTQALKYSKSKNIVYHKETHTPLTVPVSSDNRSPIR